MEVLFVAVIGVMNVLCFVVGAKVGQMVSKGEPVEMPSVDLMKPVREHKARKQAEFEQDRIDTIMQNIESYDGTSNGQKDVPRG